MAPMKLEDNIKEKLEGRTLQPSANTWNALAKQLDAHDKKQNKKLFWWFGLAASIVGVVFISTLFFKNTVTDISKPTLVETQKTIIDVNDNNVVKSQEQVAETVDMTDKIIETPKQEVKTSFQKNQKIITSENHKEAIAQTQPKTENNNKSLEILNTETTLEDLKVESVVAQINDLKEKGTISDEAIDALLDQAQKEITLQKLYNEDTKTVDANALLQDVETDLQQSFRDKVFEALQTSYDKVKTAVAQRNN
jgi:hypothetical protein